MKEIQYWLIQERGDTAYISKVGSFQSEQAVTFIGRLDATGGLAEVKKVEPNDQH